MRSLISNGCEVAGLAAVIAGAFLLATAAGFVVLGLALVVVGLAIDASRPPAPERHRS